MEDKYKEPIEGEPEALKESLPIEPVEGKPLVLEREEIEAGKEKIIEKKPEAEPEKEKRIEEVLLEKESDSTQEPPSDKVKDKIKELQGLDQENQVKTLLDLAFQKDPDFAIEVAKGLSPYVLDELHKKLTEDESYKALVDKDKLKKL
ncbi:MAG: hypothetical protein A3A94_01260 [Candidatus Portnoybacteria bacterium RIFCSPLOWO2_01_FULL_43_11]|uniref:Uncharacterized protein n=3 Tax=Candidatus Portnoyibacteriota TaxID=1817913 RepID=A0A1G2FDJ1_9BACT|nr:MAG: hypothetical protein A2815_00210 [Candidatus Portnoybacteria bacterium RIFCSPHIGHO2_01_FULL_40_12b]OGZ38264.1 MAG: hypothetical protein A3E90_02965 [Candidatus Portnoybacteria bacterium RIFCSPHIGHO2_12_FULL_40_11]OGZ38945.1 MAG: hypothetical protein A3A94_01260 [Candidatus Portnoybacteria bacterium RIFCSPLOWO2_01_FULL_43_11]